MEKTRRMPQFSFVSLSDGPVGQDIRTWLVADWLPERDVTLVGHDMERIMSHHVLPWLAYAVAQGEKDAMIDWLGVTDFIHPAKGGLPVLYLSYRHTDEQMFALLKGGLAEPLGDRFQFASLVGHKPLGNANHDYPLGEYLCDKVLPGLKPALVIIDSLALAYDPLGDLPQNDRKVDLFINRYRGIAQEHNCAIVLVNDFKDFFSINDPTPCYWDVTSLDSRGQEPNGYILHLVRSSRIEACGRSVPFKIYS